MNRKPLLICSEANDVETTNEGDYKQIFCLFNQVNSIHIDRRKKTQLVRLGFFAVVIKYR